MQFKKITYAWRGRNYGLLLLSCHLELDSEISLSHVPLTVGIMLDSYSLCSRWCIQRRRLSLGARAVSQGCPLGAAGALASGPQLSYGPCSGAANLWATHMPGPASPHPQGGPSDKGWGCPGAPLAAPLLTEAVELALAARPCPDGPL